MRSFLRCFYCLHTPKTVVNPHLLRVEIEYYALMSSDIPKIYKNRENADRPTDSIF